MNEEILDVKGAFRLLRRRWRVLVVFGLLGVLGAFFYTRSTPTLYSASSLVLLPATNPTSGGTTTTHGPTTFARIATSASVLQPAGRAVDPSLGLTTLEQRVSTHDAASGVLKITAEGSTPKQAETLADSVANHLVEFVTGSGATASSSVVAGLHGQEKAIEKQLTDVGKQISVVKERLTVVGPTSSAGRKDSQLLSTLTADQSTLSLQLGSVKSEIAQAQLAQIDDDQGTEVIQQANSATSPGPTASLLPIAPGAFAGVLLGALLLIIARKRDPRVRTRDALAESLGAPVLLSLTVPRPRTQNDWNDLLQRYQPGAMELWSVRKALREIATSEGGSPHLAVLALASDAAGVAQVVHVAVAAAASGVRTTFCVLAESESATLLRAACARFEREGESPRTSLEVHVDPTWSPEEPFVRGKGEPDGHALMVTACVLDPEHPRVAPDDGPERVAVLSVSANFATAEQLAKVGIAAADAGEPVAGLFVANPHADDHTAGRPSEPKERASLVERRRTMGTRVNSPADRMR